MQPKTPKLLLLLRALGGATLLLAVTLFPLKLSTRVASQPAAVAEATQTFAPVSVLFGGDLFLDRNIRAAAAKNGEDFLFACLGETLRTPDLAVLNLEGPITERQSVSLGSKVGSPENFQFTFPTSTAPLLKRQGVDIVNLGNNHILNFGAAGVRSTLAYLQKNGLQYFGDPQLQTVAYRDLRGVSLAFINYNEFTPTPQKEHRATVLQQIADARLHGRLPIVYTHWGDEYKTTAPLRLQTLARQFVDAGAELVVGSHPHVVEQSEVYKGKYIYYSLGNFMFDQYFSADVRQGLLIEVSFDQTGATAVREIPTTLERNGQTCLKS